MVKGEAVTVVWAKTMTDFFSVGDFELMDKF